jgi:hypothetical protein
MRRYFSTLFLGAILCYPVMSHAAAAPDKDDHRYYDAEHKDYHEWNENEDRAWRHWLEEQHRGYHDWAKANKREQREYWRWRHAHEDWH